MTGRVTLQTIADALGVSRTTVSNAYNRPDQLAPQLRERVLETARRFGYAGPDPAARRLRSGRRDAIGLLFTEALPYAFTDPAAVLLLQGLAEATAAAALPLLLLPSLGAGDQQGAVVRDAVVHAFCIYSMPEDHPEVRAALERRLPIVVVDEPRLPGHSHVGIDDRTGTRLAGEHLLALGHRRIGTVSDRTAEDGYRGPLTPAREAAATYPIVRLRLAGFRDALQAAGLDWTELPKQECGGNVIDEGRRAARELLARSPDVTAILGATDQLALGVLRHARDAGIEVPGRLSVIGFDDIPAAALAELSTIRQPLLEKGLTAGRLLLERDAGPKAVELGVELVARATTGPPPE